MKFRKLRIAWSVCWGLIAVLLTALWVRSYWQVNTLNTLHGYEIVVKQGKLDLRERLKYPVLPTVTEIVSNPWLLTRPTPPRPTIVVAASIPLWIPVVFGSQLAAAPWIPWQKRFSLRTLLIATTLVAVLLGAVIWAVR
jgi:hypothetical protein